TENLTSPKINYRTVGHLNSSTAPSAARKDLNQISSASQQFYIIRILHVHNEKDKGPTREQSLQTGAAAAPVTPVKPSANAALNFIVGNEHIETSARIELVRFTF